MSHEPEFASILIVDIVSGISVLVTLSIVLTYIMNQKSRTFCFSLIYQLCLADLIWSLSNFVSLFIYMVKKENVQIGHTVWCDVQGFFKLFSFQSSFFSTAVIAFSIYSSVIRKQKLNYENPILAFSPITIIYPLLIALVPLLDGYEQTSPFPQIMCCLPTYGYYTELIRYLAFIINFWLVLTFVSFVVVRVIFQFKKHPMNDNGPYKILIFYPLILIVCWSWLWQKRIFEFFGRESETTWMDPINLALTSMSGTLNGLVYGYSTFGKDLFKRLCICQKNQQVSNDNSLDTIKNNKSFRTTQARSLADISEELVKKQKKQKNKKKKKKQKQANEISCLQKVFPCLYSPEEQVRTQTASTDFDIEVDSDQLQFQDDSDDGGENQNEFIQEESSGGFSRNKAYGSFYTKQRKTSDDDQDQNL